jgi:hypothetical protein
LQESHEYDGAKTSGFDWSKVDRGDENIKEEFRMAWQFSSRVIDKIIFYISTLIILITFFTTIIPISIIGQLELE